MRHDQPTVGDHTPTTAEGAQHENPTTGAESTKPEPTDSAFGNPQTEATESVVSSASGGHFHKTLGESDIPRCGARGNSAAMERMTLYRAVEQTDLDRCTRCPW